MLKEPKLIIDKHQMVAKVDLLLTRLNEKIGGEKDQLSEFRQMLIFDLKKWLKETLVEEVKEEIQREPMPKVKEMGPINSNFKESSIFLELKERKKQSQDYSFQQDVLSP